MAGRPTLRTPEVETDLVLLLANGLSIRSAARVVGVSRRSLTRWLAAGLAEKRIEDDPDFRRFAELIEQEGYVAKFEGTTYRYLRIGEDVFWTSRSLWTPGQNINRRPWADVAGSPAHEQTSLPV